MKHLWILSILFFTPSLSADDWPQWMGLNRDGVWHESGIVKTIPEDGLPIVWRASVNAGYSGPAVANGRVYLMDYAKNDGAIANSPNDRTKLQGSERILCFDATTGNLMWKYEYDCPYAISYASGPRCTPTIAEGKVYALGAEGNLTCLDALTGTVIWKKDFKKEYNAPTPIWGFCGHPLVDGKRLFCLVGGDSSIAVAFDKDSGKELWRAISASESGYCPPTMITPFGTKQLVIWDADKLNAVHPHSGETIWSQPLKPSYGMSIMAPQVTSLDDDMVLFASGIGQVSALLRLSSNGDGTTVIRRGKPKTGVYCSNSTPYIENKTIYGCDCETGMLTAADLSTGKRLWETLDPTTGGTRRGRHGTAFLVQHKPKSNATSTADRTWIFSETGDLIVATLTTDSYQELGRMHILAPTNECFGRNVVWSHPAFANRCVFARNDKELVCVSLAK